MGKIADGYMPFTGYRTYYKIIGSSRSKKSPLLILHGGPGSAHNYLLGLSELAKTGRQIIFYDQLGSGRSDTPLNQNIWSLELFVSELTEIRKFLNLDEVVLYGHSWGGMLAAEYMCGQKPAGVEKVIFASSMLSVPLYRQEVEILRQDLPADVYITLKKHEKSGTTDSNEYQQAMSEYNQKHIYKFDSVPQEYQSPPHTFGKVQYEKLWGASEAHPNGSLKYWSRLEDLHMIDVPALIISGQYDELTPMQAIATCNELPDATLEIITAGTHWAHIEYQDEYLAALKSFLD